MCIRNISILNSDVSLVSIINAYIFQWNSPRNYSHFFIILVYIYIYIDMYTFKK